MGTRNRRALAIVATAAAALLGAVATATGAGVDPASYSATIASGGSVTITKTVHTPAIAPKPDLIFLADTTGSMGSAIANVKANAVNVMNSVLAGQPQAEFGVANYKDFNCDSVPFSLDQAVTASTTDTQNAINSWSASGGCDTPESALNALQVLASNPAVGFRSDSTRIIAWFGDAPSHDPTGPGNSVTQASATAALQAANVRVIAINSGFGGLDSSGQASAVTTATGGVLLNLGGGNDISAAILAGLHNLPVTVTPSPSCDPGLTASYDSSSQTVTSGNDATFQETLAVAPNAPDGGTLHCTVQFLLNGNPVDGFSQSVAIDVPLRPTDISLTKSGPAHVTEGNAITYTLVATNNGSDADTNVVATDTLPAGTAFAAADPGCTAAASVVTCMFGTIAGGGSASKQITVNVLNGAPSLLTNTASVTGDRPDSNTGNNAATATTTVNHNPVCTAIGAGPTLWPPNHKYRTLTVSGATDPDGNAVSHTITGVTQDEALNGLGDGDTSRPTRRG